MKIKQLIYTEKEHPVVGRLLRVPVDVGGQDGWNFAVTDEYEVVHFCHEPGQATSMWTFKRRVEEWYDPHPNPDDAEGCEICEGRGPRPDDITLIEVED